MYLLDYSHVKLTKTKLLRFDDQFQGPTWACGIGDTAVKFIYILRKNSSDTIIYQKNFRLI